MTSEPRTRRLVAHVEPSLADALAERADAEGRKVSQQVRVAVREHLAAGTSSAPGKTSAREDTRATRDDDLKQAGRRDAP